VDRELAAIKSKQDNPDKNTEKTRAAAPPEVGLVDRELAAIKSNQDTPDTRAEDENKKIKEAGAAPEVPRASAADVAKAAEVAKTFTAGAQGGGGGGVRGESGGGGGGGGGKEDREVAAIKGIVQRWAVEHVVRLGLCPYAAGVVDKMRTVVALDIKDAESARKLFLEEARFLIKSPESEVPTTILALPNLFAEDFMEFHSFTEDLADDLEVGGKLEHVGDDVLIAVFHPQFEFGGLEEEEEVLNFEKRAPIPIINLLRTEAIDRGIAKGITAESIREHNEEALLEEGLEGVQQAFMRSMSGTEDGE
jgi:hypothetical protein